jgi:hypothetical protein
MITREEEYYICQGDVHTEPTNPQPVPTQEQLLAVQGDIRERLTLIK